MAKLAPIYNDAQLINGIPANGALLFTYVAGSTTKQTTFADDAGLIPQTNPIVLNSRGEPAQPIWLTEGASYKFVFAASGETDPPTSPIRTIDDITGINDATVALSQWVDFGITPTYIDATSFSLPGDQTSNYQVNRRFKATVTAGTVYGYISASVFTSLTTVTVVLDSGVLDSGLSRVELGLITPTNTSLPQIPEFVNLGMLQDNIFNGLTTVPLDPANDFFTIVDVSDSGNTKKALFPIADATTYNAGTSDASFPTVKTLRENNILAGVLTATNTGATSYLITGIPAWARKITIVGDNTSTNGTSNYIIQIGDAGGIENTAYDTAGGEFAATSASTSQTTGFPMSGSVVAGTDLTWTMTLWLQDPSTNTWIASVVGHSGSTLRVASGSKSLSAPLDRFQLTTVGGVNTFDAGNFKYFVE